MDWLTARAIIAQHVRTGTDLNTPGSTYRKVLDVNACINVPRFGYRGESGFIVAVGRNADVKIPWTMLEKCFLQLSAPDGYSGKFFRRIYAPQAKEHPCHVHVVGRIFVVAGLAFAEGNKNETKYRIAGVGT